MNPSAPRVSLRAVLSAFALAMTLLFSGCGGGACVDGDCSCASDDNCSFGCSAGNCSQQCNAGSDCTVDCVGGTCLQQCDIGATCSFSCSGGGCTQMCAGSATCSASCSGGSCLAD